MAGTIQKATAQTANKANNKGPTMQQYIKQMEGEIRKALPSVITPERFTRIVLSALSTNAQLAQTTPPSFLGAMMTAAQLGVEPNTPLGQAYLIPYRNHGVLECQFQLGYKGLIDLAYRSGEVSVIQAQVVYDNDEFTYSFGLDPQLKHVPAKSDRGEPIFVYAMFRKKDSGYGFEVMSMDDVRRHAKRYSKAYNNGPWQTNFEEMAKKTVLKKVLKYAPLKSDFVRGLAQDETIKTEISEDMYSVPDVIVDDGEYEDVTDQAQPVDPETEDRRKKYLESLGSMKVDESTGEVIGEITDAR
ncbi:MAG: recombinase RecT [Clostridiaceae bacterium]|nr:recombinase RecT [Clostridiaceae bacterium]